MTSRKEQAAKAKKDPAVEHTKWFKRACTAYAVLLYRCDARWSLSFVRDKWIDLESELGFLNRTFPMAETSRHAAVQSIGNRLANMKATTKYSYRAMTDFGENIGE